MKLLLFILVFAGFVYWLYTDTQREKELQTAAESSKKDADELRTELGQTKQQLQQTQLKLQQMLADQQSGHGPAGTASGNQWMWQGGTSPLSAPATKSAGHR